MSLLVGSLAATALMFAGISCWILAGILNDKHETRLANAEYRAIEARRVRQPVMVRTIQRPEVTGRPPWPIIHRVVRTGPQWPLDVPQLPAMDIVQRVEQGTRSSGVPSAAAHPGAGRGEISQPPALNVAGPESSPDAPPGPATFPPTEAQIRDALPAWVIEILGHTTTDEAMDSICARAATAVAR